MTDNRPELHLTVLDTDGSSLDAHFDVSDGSIVFHSRGGTKGTANARNTQYGKGLRLILDRIATSPFAIQGIWVDSSRVQHLPLDERLIVSAAEAELDAPAIFSLASRRMQFVGSSAREGVGGNSNKRLRIQVSGQANDAELEHLVAGDEVSASLRSRQQVSATTAPDFTIDAKVSLPSGRVWVTSFWGFSPESEGYLGFTREGDREWLLKQLEPGDLIMIYATFSDSTTAGERGKILGFLEVEGQRIRDTDRMSPESRDWKIGASVSDRWTYAVPVVRAWRAIDMPPARSIAPETLGPRANFQLIASRGALLTEAESSAALRLRVRPVSVYGGPTLTDGERSKVYVPSRGFPMNFGRREFVTVDGEHFLYALQLEGNPALILDEPPHQLHGKVIIKIGLTKSPSDRCAQLNTGFPPASRLRWKVLLQSGPLPDGQRALDAEDALKLRFRKHFRSLGGEFFSLRRAHSRHEIREIIISYVHIEIANKFLLYSIFNILI